MAFEGLTEKISATFKKLRGKGRLKEADVKEAMREIRMALLEADVSYKVVKDFVAKVEELLAICLPSYVDEGKTSLVIAVGCTGGKHRSVAGARELGDYIATRGYVTDVSHRDMARK